MAQKSLDITKEAHLLSGKERAQLILKDGHAKLFGSPKKGFLSEPEKDALRRMTDYAVSAEYKHYLDVYSKTNVLLGQITEAYFRFENSYQLVRQGRKVLDQTPRVETLKGIIRDSIQDEKTKKDAVEIVDALYIAPVNEDSEIASFDEVLDLIKRNVQAVYNDACLFTCYKKVVDRIEKMLGFDPFGGKLFEGEYKRFKDAIKIAIGEHNAFIKNCPLTKDLEDIEDYLLIDLSWEDIDRYQEWDRFLKTGKIR